VKYLLSALLVVAAIAGCGSSEPPPMIPSSKMADDLNLPHFCRAYHDATRPDASIPRGMTGSEHAYRLFRIGYELQVERGVRGVPANVGAPSARAVFNELVKLC